MQQQSEAIAEAVAMNADPLAAASAPQTRAGAPVAWKLRAQRLLYRLGNTLAPELTGRMATDAFGYTRSQVGVPGDRTPLGAQRFRIFGNADIEQGFIWKKDGPTALLVHGWATDSSSMLGFVKPMQKLGFQVATFDAPAHGISKGDDTTMTQFTRAVKDTLDTLGGADIVIAHSLGSIATVGAIMERGLAKAPRCIVMIAPTCTLSEVLERWSADHFRLVRPIVERIYRELHRRNGVPVSHWNIVTLGKGLDVPVLVVHDPGDPVVPFGEAERVVRALPRAQLKKAGALGHVRILSANSVKDMVSEFIGQHGVTDASATAVERVR